MRAACLSLAVLLLPAAVLAEPPGAYTSAEGRYSITFPGEPKTSSKTTRSDVGELKVSVATYATSAGQVYLVSYTDFPPAATKPENRDTMYDGVRDGVKGRDGKVVREKEIDFGPDKLPARELVVDKEKGKQRIKLRMILRGDRLYQVLVMGTTEFVEGRDAAKFIESLELTK